MLDAAAYLTRNQFDSWEITVFQKASAKKTSQGQKKPLPTKILRDYEANSLPPSSWKHSALNKCVEGKQDKCVHVIRCLLMLLMRYNCLISLSLTSFYPIPFICFPWFSPSLHGLDPHNFLWLFLFLFLCVSVSSPLSIQAAPFSHTFLFMILAQYHPHGSTGPSQFLFSLQSLLLSSLYLTLSPPVQGGFQSSVFLHLFLSLPSPQGHDCSVYSSCGITDLGVAGQEAGDKCKYWRL